MSKSITEHLDPSEQRRMTITLDYHQTFCIQHLRKVEEKIEKTDSKRSNYSFILATTKLKLLSLLQKWRNKGYEAF